MTLRSITRIRRSHLLWHLVFSALVLLLLYVVIRGLGEVLTPVAAALVLSFLLDPLVTSLERRLHISRLLGAVLLFLLALMLMSLVLLLVVPVMVRELHAFAEAVPGYVEKIRSAVVPYVEGTFGVRIPNTLHEIANQFGADLKVLASKSLAPLGGMAGRVAIGAAGLVSTLGMLLLIPVFTFFFLPKFPAILGWVQDLIPRRYLPWVRETALEVDRALAAWIRGQLTVMMVLATLYSVGLSVFGIKMAVLIGVLSGCLAFIPYVGVVIGITLALLVSLLEYTGAGPIIGVLVVFGTVQTLDGLLITPFLVGERVGLGPVGVLLALMLGGNLFGFVGVLLAVPTAAALVVVIRRALAAYRSSLFYLKGGDPSPPPAPDELACAPDAPVHVLPEGPQAAPRAGDPRVPDSPGGPDAALPPGGGTKAGGSPAGSG